MGKLFLKLWILLMATAYVSYAIQTYFFELAQEERSKNVRYRVPVSTGTAEAIAWMLREFPVAEWPARLKENGPPFSFPVELVPIDKLMDQYNVDVTKFSPMQNGRNIVTNSTDMKNMLVVTPVAKTDYVLVMKMPPEWPPLRLFGMMSVSTFTWLTVCILYGSAVLLWLSLFWRDLTRLIHASDKIGDGDFHFKAEVRSGSALYPLANSLSRMTARIAALVNSHKALTNAISHEFRTPITRLRFRHELAQQATTVVEKNHELQLMDSAIDQLDDLSTELLEYARLDRETPVLSIADIDVETWLGELACEARELAVATGREVQIGVHVDSDSVEGDYRYLSRAAANLLHNAVRYANRMVAVHVEQRGGKRYLHVDDDGPGIPESEYECLFEPFARLDKSRDRQSGGFGIGLAIVKQIARWHGGTATITQSQLGGARVSVCW